MTQFPKSVTWFPERRIGLANKKEDLFSRNQVTFYHIFRRPNHIFSKPDHIFRKPSHIFWESGSPIRIPNNFRKLGHIFNCSFKYPIPSRIHWLTNLLTIVTLRMSHHPLVLVGSFGWLIDRHLNDLSV